MRLELCRKNDFQEFKVATVSELAMANFRRLVHAGAGLER